MHLFIHEQMFQAQRMEQRITNNSEILLECPSSIYFSPPNYNGRFYPFSTLSKWNHKKILFCNWLHLDSVVLVKFIYIVTNSYSLFIPIIL